MKFEIVIGIMVEKNNQALCTETKMRSDSDGIER